MPRQIFKALQQQYPSVQELLKGTLAGASENDSRYTVAGDLIRRMNSRVAKSTLWVNVQLTQDLARGLTETQSRMWPVPLSVDRRRDVEMLHSTLIQPESWKHKLKRRKWIPLSDVMNKWRQKDPGASPAAYLIARGADGRSRLNGDPLWSWFYPTGALAILSKTGKDYVVDQGGSSTALGQIFDSDFNLWLDGWLEEAGMQDEVQYYVGIEDVGSTPDARIFAGFNGEFTLEAIAVLRTFCTIVHLPEFRTACQRANLLDPAGRNAIIRQNAEYWRVSFEGHTSDVKDTDSVRCLLYVLAKGHDGVTCTELAEQFIKPVGGSMAFAATGSGGAVNPGDDPRPHTGGDESGFQEEVVSVNRGDDLSPHTPAQYKSPVGRGECDSTRRVTKRWIQQLTEGLDLLTKKDAGMNLGEEELKRLLSIRQKLNVDLTRDLLETQLAEAKKLLQIMRPEEENWLHSARTNVRTKIWNGVSEIWFANEDLAKHLCRYLETGTACRYNGSLDWTTLPSLEDLKRTALPPRPSLEEVKKTCRELRKARDPRRTSAKPAV